MLTHSTRPSASGFTLIEVLVTVVILGVVAALGLPSMTQMIRNAEVRTAAESVLSGLQIARTEAVRRNSLVAFTLDTPGSMGMTGWGITIATTGESIQKKAAGEGSRNVVATPVASDTTVTFNGYGRVRYDEATKKYINLDGSDALTQIDLTATGSDRALRIVILYGGEIRMCDPAVSAAGDPRKC